MKITTSGCSLFFVVLLLLSGLTGCAGHSPETSFYQLTSLSQSGQAAGQVEADNFSVGVGPSSIPEYLNRPQIVTRKNNTQLMVEEFHRWASPLDREIAAVIVDNLTVLIGSQKVVTFPWDQYAKPDYRVIYDIHRFDSVLGEKATLAVRWTVFDSGEQKVNKVYRKTYEKPLPDATYLTLVQAQSELLADMSRDIASELIRLSKTGG